MPDDLLGGTGRTDAAYKAEMRALILDPDYPDHGIVWGSEEAQQRWMKLRLSRALKCQRCGRSLFLQSGEPVERKHVPPGMVAMCAECRERY